MANNHIQPGKVLDYTNATGAPIASGSVVAVGTTLGVALADIAAGATGAVAIDGVFAVPKVAGTAITQGAAVIFQAVTQAFTVGTAASGDISGACAIAFAAAAADATTVHVKFTGCPGTVKA